LSEDSVEAATHAETVGEKILSTLSQNYLVASVTHHSTASIGITLFGEQEENLEEPLRRADLAMYQAKSAGRNTIRFFDPEMQAAVTAHAALEQELRAALTQDQLFLHYQPQVDRDGNFIGAEALVRWQHPVQGTVFPARFIPLAEETGLIVQLGTQVLQFACLELARWAKDPDFSQLTMAVNVSPRQFNQKDFVAQILSVLERTGADPKRLKLELTESLFVFDFEDVIKTMSALKNHGVTFSLDDFGTGYSSLSYLKRLPLDQLKIDQSFVRDILSDANDAAIAKMVIVLADTLGLSVIAEGVETMAQQDALFGQGCNAYQGYLFSRPLPLQEFKILVKQKKAKDQPG
jgi:predicted signal transduction protein with EAL and GGDEF domain